MCCSVLTSMCSSPRTQSHICTRALAQSKVNPLAETSEALVAADAKLGFDDNASFRQARGMGRGGSAAAVSVAVALPLLAAPPPALLPRTAAATLSKPHACLVCPAEGSV